MSTGGADQVQADRLHRSHLAALLPALGDASLDRLASCGRLSGRLVASLGAAAELPPATSLSERLVLLPASRIEAAGLMMGAAWHARQIGRCINSQDVDALDAAIGRAVRMFGLRTAALAVAQPAEIASGALAGAVIRDGMACLGRWRDQLDEPWRALAALKLPREGLPPPALAEHADPIIARVSEEVLDVG